MSYTAPTVNYCATINGTYTQLNGVQSAVIRVGRQRFQDNFTAGVCEVEIIPDASYALPLAIGQFLDVRVSNSGAADAYFCGQITDVQRDYAVPYNSGTGVAPADRIRVTATSGMGALALTTVTDYTWPTTYATTMLDAFITALGLGFLYESSLVRVLGETYSGGSLDAVNKLLRTLQYVISDAVTDRVTNNRYLTATSLGYGWNAPIVFADDGTGGAYKFRGLQYLSSVQNSFTQVNVQPDNLATQTASTGSPPYNSLDYTTNNETTADALSLANYILTVTGQTTPVPFVLQSDTNADASVTQVAKWINTYTSNKSHIGAPVQVKFRGGTALASIQGISSAFYPDRANVQLYLSPSLGTPFTLDSSAFGVLDQNRLGFP